MEEKLDQLTHKTEEISLKLEKFLSSAKKISENPLSFLKKKKIDVVKKWIKNNTGA